MAGANQRLDGQLPRLRMEPGNLFEDDDVIRIGEAAEASLLRLMMMALYDENNSLPLTGVFGEPDAATHLAVSKGTGDLNYDVTTGAGFVYDGTATDDAFNELDYRLVTLATAVTNNSVGAHDPTNARIDVISIAPAVVEDTPEARVTRNVTTGDPVDPDPSVNMRSRPGGTITVTAGTPAATPLVPATPAGHIKLAEVLVPATSGAITVTDFREFVQVTSALRGLPPGWMHQPHIAGSTGLVVTLATTTTVDVSLGYYVDAAGTYRRYEGETAVSLGTAPTGNQERVDLVSLNPATGAAVATNGTVVDTTAVDGGVPLPPALPAGHIPLAEVLSDSTGIQTVTGTREFGHIGSAQLGLDAIEAKHVKRATRTIKIPAASFAPDGVNPGEARSGGRISMSTGGGGDTWTFSAGIDLPTGTKVLEAGWVAYETLGTGTIEGAFRRHKMFPNAGTADDQTIAADAGPQNLGTTLTQVSPALGASEDPQVVKDDFVYGISVQIALNATSTVVFVGAYVVVEIDEVLPGTAGDVS